MGEPGSDSGPVATEPCDSGPVTKIMSLSEREFLRSLGHLSGNAHTSGGDNTYRLALGSGAAIIACEPLPPASPGGLLSLPRCRVTISFENTGPCEQQRFVARFNDAFRRGGG